MTMGKPIKNLRVAWGGTIYKVMYKEERDVPLTYVSEQLLDMILQDKDPEKPGRKSAEFLADEEH